MGKVECWSETKTPKPNNGAVVALENKLLRDPRRGFRWISKLGFPEAHRRAQEYYSAVPWV